MSTITVSNFQVLQWGEFTLPGLQSGPPGHPSTHIRADQTFHFKLPADVMPEGLVAFTVDTIRGNDNAIDLAFEVSVNASTQWKGVYKHNVFNAMHWPISGLRPGDNHLTFHMTKGGKMTEPNPDESLGGKGKVEIGGVTIWYQESIPIP